MIFYIGLSVIILKESKKTDDIYKTFFVSINDPLQNLYFRYIKSTVFTAGLDGEISNLNLILDSVVGAYTKNSKYLNFFKKNNVKCKDTVFSIGQEKQISYKKIFKFNFRSKALKNIDDCLAHVIELLDKEINIVTKDKYLNTLETLKFYMSGYERDNTENICDWFLKYDGKDICITNNIKEPKFLNQIINFNIENLTKITKETENLTYKFIRIDGFLVEKVEKKLFYFVLLWAILTIILIYIIYSFYFNQKLNNFNKKIIKDIFK